MRRIFGLLAVIASVTIATGCNPGVPSSTPTPQPTSQSIPTATTVPQTATPVSTPTVASTATAQTESKSPPASTATVSSGAAHATATEMAAIATSTSYAASTPPPGKYGPDPLLVADWKDYIGGIQGAVAHNFLGWALQPAKNTRMAIQRFGRFGGPSCTASDSLMIWREDTRFVYFMIEGNFGLHAESCRNWWRSYLDTWQPGGSNNVDLTPPAGKTVPKMGLGKVWRENFYGKASEGLDFATGPEEYFDATVQSFDNGLMFRRNDSGEIYVLFNRFDYWTRGGLSWDKVWFRIDGSSR